jgi:hypothetical protein
MDRDIPPISPVMNDIFRLSDCFDWLRFNSKFGHFQRRFWTHVRNLKIDGK